LERIANRIVLAMIVAALMVGLGVSASFYHLSIPSLGLFVTVGLVIASLLGVALAWSVFRSSR
jgi:heme A synthase